MRRGALIAAIALASCAAARPVPQERARATPPPLSATVVFGWNSIIPADAWGPVTVQISAGDRVVGGVVLVEFEQDATQRAQLVTPFATTPSQTTSVPLVASIPGTATRIDVTILPETGRPITLKYRASPAGDELPLPRYLANHEYLVVSVGPTSLTQAHRRWEDEASIPARAPNIPADPDTLRWSMVTTTRVEAPSLPVHWMAYDGVGALIVRGSDAHTADARARAAIAAWVEFGGRLIVLADSPGDGWRDWLPESAGAMFTAGAIGELEVPPSLANIVRRARDGAQPAERFVGRALSLTQRGERHGWRRRWGPSWGNEPDGLLVEGPVGFGWVAVIGLEPQFASATLDYAVVGEAWADVLRTGLFNDKPASQFEFGPRLFSRVNATVVALERLAPRAVPAGAAFVFIIAAMGLLAILVGPVDAIVLKSFKLRHRSWLTALGWIALLSAGAYAIPLVSRATARTSMSRLTVTDGIREEGEPLIRRAERTALTGVFAARSGRLRFAADPGAWWRGVSGIADYSGQQRLGSVVTLPQSTALDARGRPLGTVPDRVPVGIWTFRTFADDSRPDVSLSARVTATGDRWSVTVEGLPRGARVIDAAVRTYSRWAPLAQNGVTRGSGGDSWNRGTGARDARLLIGEDRAWSIEFDARESWSSHMARWMPRESEGSYGYWSAAVASEPSSALDIVSAARRSHAIDRRLATGKWACVYLHVEGPESDTSIDWASDDWCAWVYRLLVPLEQDDGGDGRAP